MKTRILITVQIFLLFFTTYAQEIEIRSVPLIGVNQTDFQPSLSRGMGNLSIAFDDPISDPFINPANASKLNGVNLFFSPTLNLWSNKEGSSISSNWGSSKYTGTGVNSLPFGLFLRKDNFFAGGIITYQSYSSERSTLTNWIWYGNQVNNSVKKDNGDNTYLFGLIGISIPEMKVSIAGSFSWSKYKALDGINLLYPGSYDINQDGWSLGFKLGLIGEISEKDQLELVIGRSIFKSSHEVLYYMPYIWSMAGGYRSELNKDESNSWVIQTKYNRSINNGWKLGAIFTLNWKEHPKIPNYSLANIPRDPGFSTAFNLGIGFTHTGEKTIAGFEYIYEPISSNTWATPDELSSLPPTFKTVENSFDFYDHIFRAGILSHTEFKWFDYRLGAQLHFYKYDLGQVDNLRHNSRNADEHWLETSLCGGLTFKFSGFQIYYTLQIILGNGLVGTQTNNIIPLMDYASDKSASDFLIAPSGPLTVDNITLITQQITFLYNL